MKIAAARRLELAREVAAEQIFEGLGLDVEDLTDTRIVGPLAERVESGVGVWVPVRVLVKDEAIEALAKAQRSHRRRPARRRGR